MRRARPAPDRAGFTLVELFMVFVVVGVLAGIAVPMMRGAIQRADAAHVVSDARNIETAVLAHYEDTGTVPATTDWGEAPPELAGTIGNILFTYEECEYRLVTAPASETVRLRVRYPEGSPIGVALQAYHAPGDVVWTSTRTDFYILN